MTKNLVIVESPAKAKTIEKYLGKDFKVMASYGHVRDLLPKKSAVDPDNEFAMQYENIERNEKHVKEIKKAIKSVDTLCLATDPDREGEAIAWHIYQIMQEQKALKNKEIKRIIFHEITKSAIQEAIKNPHSIDMNLVNAQQARRALDFLVGFNLSPLLWKKVQTGLSAGRVQSPALRLIVEREESIERFQKQEYWTIEAACVAQKTSFSAKLTVFDSKKVEQFTITNNKQVEQIKETLEKNAKKKLIAIQVEKKTRRRNPPPPFTTSTLQQEASRKLGFGTARTMRIAQQLYEGIDIGNETIGLITYMRTDSVNLAKEAVLQMREYIVKTFGKEAIPEAPRVFETKSKNAQEAHEAIRPTNVNHDPDAIKERLTNDQYKLYQLIWKRALASQMMYATLSLVAIDLACGENKEHIFRATGSTIVSPGFLSIYQEGRDDDASVEDDSEKLLPEINEGDIVDCTKIDGLQHFTEPPPRYTEASLVKALEEYGIGRPSTYATIITTLQNRNYVILGKKRFYPTDVGRVVNKFLTEYFPKYIDYDFTAHLEDSLDSVSRGEKVWIPLLREFWQPFKKLLDHVESSVKRKDVTQELIDEKCPKCGKPLVSRLGRNGKFIGCTGYPECDYTRAIEKKLGEGEVAEPQAATIVENRLCPKCNSALVWRKGKYGPFIGCSAYPKCDFIESSNKPKDTGVGCPECYKANLLMRKTRRGKIFYSCASYPACKYAIWNAPIAERCPKCGWPILTIKATKSKGTQKICPQKNCGYTISAEEEKEEN